MHPILGHRGRLLIYLASWLPISVLLGGLLAAEEGRFFAAFALALPLTLVYAFICLAAWFPSRVTPLSKAHVWQAVVNHLLAALLSTSMWQLAGVAWAWLLGNAMGLREAQQLFSDQSPIFIAVGVLLYLLTAAGSYLYMAVESALETERAAFEDRQQRELADRELALARGLQRRLLPPTSLAGSGFVLEARNLAAAGVAGDFYDYFQLPDATLRVAVADVAGKGMAASLIMATVKAILPMIAAERSVVDTFGELNRRLSDQLERREFVAMSLAEVDPESGRVRLSNAGLPDAYVLRRGGGIEAFEVPMPRLPLGIRPALVYSSLEIQLAVGDRLLMLTDGLPEALVSEGEPLGYERFETLLDHRDEAPSLWLDRLIDRVRQATHATQDDDWTLLLIERRALMGEGDRGADA